MVSRTLAAAGIGLSLLGISCSQGAQPGGLPTLSSQDPLEQSFENASQRYQVPAEILKAISYQETHWHQMAGVMSLDHGYGLMHLRDLGGPMPTLQRAQLLTGIDEATLKQDPDSNVQGGAAVLQQLYQETSGTPHPGDQGSQQLASWFDAVSRYGGGDEDAAAGRRFAQGVFEILMGGATDPDGSGLSIPAQSILLPPNDLVAEDQAYATPDYGGARWVSASPSNYTVSWRPGSDYIHYIIVHDMEGSYSSAISWFANPASQVSAHYNIRSSDGQITQMVQEKDIAWHAGCWWMNQHSVGIEHEGYMSQKGWYTDVMYRSSAALARYLVHKYGIPVDRNHIIGHSELYDITDDTGVKECAWVPSGERHWDPGPNWNWDVYMAYIRGGSGDSGGGSSGGGSCPNGDGLYCGGNGVSGNTNDLYRCTGGRLSLVQSCGNGCERMPSGSPDRCRPAPAPRACPDGNGAYCGGNGVAGDQNTLYLCTNGTLRELRACANGCERMPANLPDRCRPTSCPGGDGLYCGGNGVSGNANSLYKCAGGELTQVEACRDGCERMPNGVPDRCRPAPAPKPCPNGDGLYCGGDGVGGNPSVLYECKGGTLREVKSCGSGCERMPAGSADRCRATCPDGNGLYCGGDGVGGATNTLYDCHGGTLTVDQVCAGGCESMPANMPDRCRPTTSTCPNGDGLYCGGDGISGNPNTLYECRGGSLTAVETCSAGCQKMPTGVPDQCAGTGGSSGGSSGGTSGGSGSSGG